MFNHLRSSLKNKKGQTAAEYALVLLGVAIVVIAVFINNNGGIQKLIQNVLTSVETKVNSATT